MSLAQVPGLVHPPFYSRGWRQSCNYLEPDAMAKAKSLEPTLGGRGRICPPTGPSHGKPDLPRVPSQASHGLCLRLLVLPPAPA